MLTHGTGTTDALVQLMSTASKALDDKCMYGVQCLFIVTCEAMNGIVCNERQKFDVLVRKCFSVLLRFPYKIKVLA